VLIDGTHKPSNSPISSQALLQSAPTSHPRTRHCSETSWEPPHGAIFKLPVRASLTRREDRRTSTPRKAVEYPSSGESVCAAYEHNLKRKGSCRGGLASAWRSRKCTSKNLDELPDPEACRRHRSNHVQFSPTLARGAVAVGPPTNTRKWLPINGEWWPRSRPTCSKFFS
jgi:hypothetical protein